VPIRKSALIAAVATILWDLLIIAPNLFGFETEHPTDWTNWGLAVFQSLTLTIFLFAVYLARHPLGSSTRMRLSAIAAGFFLSVENLPLSYRNIRNVYVACQDVFAWKYHPFAEMRYVLREAIPTITVVSLILFLVVVYRASARPGQTTDSAPTGVRMAALLALVGCVAVLGQLASFVFANPIPQTWRFAVQLSLRVLTPGSLALFFIFVWAAQRKQGYLPIEDANRG
jgi:hypothetical protein